MNLKNKKNKKRIIMEKLNNSYNPNIISDIAYL